MSIHFMTHLQMPTRVLTVSPSNPDLLLQIEVTFRPVVHTVLYLSSLGEFLLLAEDGEGVQVLEGASGFRLGLVERHVEREDHRLQFVLHQCLEVIQTRFTQDVSAC